MRQQLAGAASDAKAKEEQKEKEAKEAKKEKARKSLDRRKAEVLAKEAELDALNEE